MYTPFFCAGCEQKFEEGQFYWEFFDEDGGPFYLDEFCRDAYLLEQRKQYIPGNHAEEREAG